jgi:hypothetical protein
MKKKIKLLSIVISSLIPGLPQIILGRVKKSIGLFCIDIGLLATVVFTDSYTMLFLVSAVYVFTFVPAGIEAYQLAKYGENTFDIHKRGYVIILLLTTGFSALPLLWQSSKFNKKAKIYWTIAVPVLAVLFFLFVALYWHSIEFFLRQLFN